MKSSASIRSFYCAGSHLLTFLEKPSVVSVNSFTKSQLQGTKVSWQSSYPLKRQKGTVVSCIKTAKTSKTVESDVSSPSISQSLLEKKHTHNATFPNGVEALVLEVCDETQIAELKLKVGEFEMHLKRNIGVTTTPLSGISPTAPPPIPTEPMVESTPVTSLSPPSKSSPEKTSPFTNDQLEKSSKLAALEASGSKGYVLVSSPTVGSFRRGRTVKGKKQPAICKEGGLIKEGQVIGYLDQFGTELPVKSDVAGEVLKLLFSEGESVGYGDPLIAVLPSFHAIK